MPETADFSTRYATEAARLARGAPAELLLSDRLAAHTGVRIVPSALRSFLRENWPVVVVLAHAIHDTQEERGLAQAMKVDAPASAWQSIAGPGETSRLRVPDGWIYRVDGQLLHIVAS